MRLYVLDAMNTSLRAPGAGPGCCIYAITYRDRREVGRTWLRDGTIARHPSETDLAHAPDDVPQSINWESSDGTIGLLHRAIYPDRPGGTLLKIGSDDVTAVYGCKLRLETPATMAELIDLIYREKDREPEIDRTDLPLLARALERTGRIFHRRRSSNVLTDNVPAVYWSELAAGHKTLKVCGQEFLNLNVRDAAGRPTPADDATEAHRHGARVASTVPIPELD